MPHPAATEPVSLRLPFGPRSASVARSELQSWLRDLGQPDEVIEDSRLVVSELVGNAVRHARPRPDGTVEVTWTPVRDGLEITVADGGGATTPALAQAAEQSQSGRGLSIVDSLASRWWCESGRDGAVVHAMLRLVPGPRRG